MHNSLLVRWNGGWSEVTDTTSISAHGRSEALLGLGAIQSLAEVQRVARGQLDIFANPRTEIAADFAPASYADTPYLSFGVGDSVLVPDYDGTVSRERVQALTVAEDENGVVTFAPDFKDVILDRRERWERALKKMIDGTVGGQSAVASPAASVGGQVSAPPPVYNAPTAAGQPLALTMLSAGQYDSEYTGYFTTLSNTWYSAGAEEYLQPTSNYDLDTWFVMDVLKACMLLVTARFTFQGSTTGQTCLGWDQNIYPYTRAVIGPYNNSIYYGGLSSYANETVTAVIPSGEGDRIMPQIFDNVGDARRYINCYLSAIVLTDQYPQS